MFTIEKQAAKKLLSLSDFHNIDSLCINPHFEEALCPSEDYAKRFEIWLPNYHTYSSMSDYLYPRASVERLITIKLFCCTTSTILTTKILPTCSLILKQN